MYIASCSNCFIPLFYFGVQPQKWLHCRGRFSDLLEENA